MNKGLADYVDEIIADLRAKRITAETLLAEINKTPVLDHLRARVRESDSEWLQEMALDDRESHYSLGISLLRSLQHDARIRIFLFNLWQNDTSYKRRWWVMFRLLDYPELPIETHRELFEFTKANWKQWITDVVNHFGGPAELLSVLEARLQSASWPQSKTWVRVLEALGARDKESLREFLNRIAASRFTAPLVTEALQFASEKQPGCINTSSQALVHV